MSSLSLPLSKQAPSKQALSTKAPRAAFGQIVLNEARLARRRPIALIGGVGLPLVLLIIFGEVHPFRQPLATLHGGTLFDGYVPVLMVFGVALLALLGLPIPLVSYRELGVLRRLSTTPVPPSWLLAAQGVVQLGTALITGVAVIVISLTAFGVPAPKSPGGLVLSFLLAVAALFAIGLVIASLARTATAVNVIGRVTFFPLMFFAGLWLPRALMPSVLYDISNYTPLGAAVQAVQASMQTGFPPVAPLLVLAAYALIFGFVARRFFRWE
jgi:ABC-2 type transport system permease protein